MSIFRTSVEDVEFKIEYTYEKVKGEFTYASGDPGYPSCEDTEIEGIFIKGVEVSYIIDPLIEEKIREKLKDYCYSVEENTRL